MPGIKLPVHFIDTLYQMRAGLRGPKRGLEAVIR